MATKKGPDMAFLAKMMEEHAAKTGAAVVDVAAVTVLEDRAELDDRNRTLRMQETELVLRSQHYRHSLMFKNCAECGATFQTNFCYVGFCSDSCRNDAFYKRFHVTVTRIKTPQEFEHEPFGIVSSEMTEGLYQWAKSFVSDYEDFKSQTSGQNQGQQVPYSSQGPDVRLKETEPDSLVEQEASTNLDTVSDLPETVGYAPLESVPLPPAIPEHFEILDDDEAFLSPFQ